MRFLALDFETSGLDHSRHAPVQLGVAVFDGGNVVAEREWLMGPPTDKNGKISREYSIAALEVSGISWGAIKKAPPIAQVMRELLTWAEPFKSDTVVAFNAPFDFSWYSECLFLGGSWNQASRRFETFKPPLVGPWQCARLLAVDNLSLFAYSLDSVAEHFGLARSSEKHGALEDAILAGQIYERLR